MSGDTFLKSLAETAAEPHRPRTAKGLERKHEELTPRQYDVLVEALEGKTCKQIGSALFISEKCVKFHLTAIYKVLNVSGRGALLSKCLARAQGYRLNDKQEFEEIK